MNVLVKSIKMDKWTCLSDIGMSDSDLSSKGTCGLHSLHKLTVHDLLVTFYKHCGKFWTSHHLDVRITGLFRKFSTRVLQNAHVNIGRHAKVCDVCFPFPKI